MKYLFLLLSLFFSLSVYSSSDNDKWKILNERTEILQKNLSGCESTLRRLDSKLKETESKTSSLVDTCATQGAEIDSLQSVCKVLIETQSTDRKITNRNFDTTNAKVQINQETLRSRTWWGVTFVIAFIVIIIVGSYRLVKRINSGKSTIADVRKAQEALQTAQSKMQEESIKLDDKLLELLDKQMSIIPKVANDDVHDHSFALKVADEIVRIELNMSRMDSSIKGYKQLAKAVERIKDNFKANGYEIVDMLGKPYNEGMKVTANFVVDEDLEEGKQIITGITKPQINYNGQMIQAAQITVSQNI